MKGIGYCRVSTREQAIEGFSLETQTREITDYCKEHNIELLNIYVESGESAYKKDIKDRPQGRLVLEHIYNKDIECVVLISDDRMFRNLENSIAFDTFAEQNNVSIIYTRQSYFDHLDKSSKFFVKNMSAIINQYYSEVVSTKVKNGHFNKVKKGEWNGKSPYGYDLVNGNLEINEEQASIIRLIFSMYLEGKGGELICNYLNENNHTPPKSKHWSKNSVLGMLRNEVYTGTTIYNKRAPKKSGKKYNPENEWLVMENTHPPIISKEDFEKVREISGRRKRQSGTNNIDRTLTSLAPLAGLIHCKKCGELYLPTSGSSKKRGKINYYGCGSRRRNGKSVCDTHLVQAELLEKFVLYRIKEILTSDMYKKHFELQLTRELEILQSKKKDINRIKQDIAKITTQKNKLLDLIINEDNESLVNSYKEKLKEVLAQISFHNEQLALYESIDIPEEERVIREQFNLSHEDITYRDFQDLSKEQLKVLFNYLIDYIEIEELKLDNEPKVILYITIHLKFDGYAPKFALHEINKLPTKGKEKSKQFSSLENCLQNGGGEGGI